MNTVINGVAPLPQLGVIRVAGEDAAKFLQGQLTQDFALLGSDRARLAAFCSARGRMQASFTGFTRADGEILLVCSHDILAATLKRLSMFVLRAKAKLTDASGDVSLYGVFGGSMTAISGASHEAWSKLDVGDANLIELYPADGMRRGLWVAPAEHAAPAGPTLAADVWDWLEVRSGIARISTPIVEAFVPQMLNYESVGGVNFKKGCYPGQEVVARSQFRGTLKRRAYIVKSDAPLLAGQEVFHESDASQPCGTIAQAAVSPDGVVSAIASLQITSTQGGALRAAGADGPLLELAPLPYLLLADV